MSVVLTVYSCLELAKLVANVGNKSSSITYFAANCFLKEKRSLVWICLSVLHSITVTLFGAPYVYSPIFGTYNLNPHAGYIEDVNEKLYNLHSQIHTKALLFVGVVLFIAFVYLMRSLRKLNSDGASRQVLAAEQKAWVQALIISCCFAISIIYWYVAFSGATVPHIVIFFGMTISVCTHGAPGLLHVCMNETVRDSVLELLRIKTKRTTGFRASKSVTLIKRIKIGKG